MFATFEKVVWIREGCRFLTRSTHFSKVRQRVCAIYTLLSLFLVKKNHMEIAQTDWQPWKNGWNGCAPNISCQFHPLSQGWQCVCAISIMYALFWFKQHGLATLKKSGNWQWLIISYQPNPLFGKNGGKHSHLHQHSSLCLRWGRPLKPTGRCSLASDQWRPPVLVPV